MDQTSVPFGDDVGLEVLAALRELGEGLTKLSDIESISKSGEPASSSKQFDILQSVNRSIAISRWSTQQQEMQLSRMSESSPSQSSQSLSPSQTTLPNGLSPKNNKNKVLLAKRFSFFVANEANDVSNDDVQDSCLVNGTIMDTSEYETVIPCSSGEDLDVSYAVEESEGIDNEVNSALNIELEAEAVETRISDELYNEEEHEGEDDDDDDDRGEEELEDGDEEEGDDEQEDVINDNQDDDEWEDDEDPGFVMLKVTEEEFFEMEEECAFRQQLVRQSPYAEDLRGVEGNDCSPLQGHLNLEDSDSNSDEDCRRDNVTSKRGGRGHVNIADMSLDSDVIDDLGPPSPPPIEDESDQDDDLEEDESHEQSKDSMDDDENDDDDLAAVERELGIDSCNSIADLPPIEVDEVKSYPLPITPPRDEAPVLGKGHMSRRVSEIMGQKKIRGVDGEHCFFDLKVIFDPYRTGFEEDKNFNPPRGTIIAGRYEMMEVLGQAAFSTALQCVDLTAEEDEDGNERSQWVCLKVIKNSKDFFDQSLDEIKLLQYINSKGNPHEHNVLQMIDYFYCKEHLFIVSELLRENLYEFQKYIRESGGVEYFTPNRLKRIMKQILEALVYIQSLNLLHCDIKPENIVIKSYSRCDVKLIDFGSSCFVTDHLTSYIQSRSYRAPEVILGLEYSYGIDIWSLGGVLAEMHTAYVLFQNDSIASMLCRIEGILGAYPKHMMETGAESPKYFNMSGIIYERDEEDGLISLLYPKKTSLRSRLHLPAEGLATEDEELFLDFVNLMLQIDPAKRLSAAQALKHPWLDGVDELDVAYNIEDANPPLPIENDIDVTNEDDFEYDDEDEASYDPSE